MCAAKPDTTTWKAEPQTLAKIQILRDYLIPYYQIMGLKHPGNLVFVDAFAGAGEYAGQESGSPLTALETWRQIRAELADKWRPKGSHFIFIEEKRKRHAHLSGLIPPYANSDDSTCVALHGDFRDLFDTLPVRIPTLWAVNTKRFFFLDPFGVKGIRFDQVKKIMECPGSEIFLLLDGDGIDRVAKANNHACAAILDELFGADGWQSQVRLGSDMSGMDDRCQRVCAHYKSLLKSIDGVKYTFQFEMRSATNRHTYFLLFASRHKTGLLKMKEAMKRRDNTGEYQYCLGREGQVNLRLFNRVADDADSMHGYFGGDPDRFWTIDTIEEYALCETGFLNPKSMLAHLEKGGRIEVSPDSGRRNFTFADGAVTGVRFLKTPRVRHNIQPDMLNG